MVLEIGLALSKVFIFFLVDWCGDAMHGCLNRRLNRRLNIHLFDSTVGLYVQVCDSDKACGVPKFVFPHLPLSEGRRNALRGLKHTAPPPCTLNTQCSCLHASELCVVKHDIIDHDTSLIIEYAFANDAPYVTVIITFDVVLIVYPKHVCPYQAPLFRANQVHVVL